MSSPLSYMYNVYSEKCMYKAATLTELTYMDMYMYIVYSEKMKVNVHVGMGAH